jgi:hypothetical protein
MALSRRSGSAEPNPDLREEPAQQGEGNRKWLARLGNEDGVILIGGTSLADFRLRVAQSSLRSDMLPSYWSLCGILLKGEIFASVPLGPGSDISAIPKCNAVRTCPLEEYDDPQLYPNVAVIRFAKIHKTVHEDIRHLREDRTILDFPPLMLPWLGFVWGTGGAPNPLINGIGIPSAAFVETVFAMAGFELTPGLSSASSCPEAIWQSAKWWADFYKGATETTQVKGKSAKSRASEEKDAKAAAMVPTGFYILRQRAAAVIASDVP